MISFQRNRRQCVIFDGRQGMFPCKYGLKANQTQKAQNVHHLTPADIDVVAALGDSISSGVGALAKNILGIRPYRILQKKFVTLQAVFWYENRIQKTECDLELR